MVPFNSQKHYDRQGSRGFAEFAATIAPRVPGHSNLKRFKKSSTKIDQVSWIKDRDTRENFFSI